MSDRYQVTWNDMLKDGSEIHPDQEGAMITARQMFERGYDVRVCRIDDDGMVLEKLMQA